MDSTLTQTMFMRGEVQPDAVNVSVFVNSISIPVLRGEVQLLSLPTTTEGILFQFPYCVGKFNEYR